MKRSTITLPDDLAAAVQAYSESQEVQPTVTAVVQSGVARVPFPPRRVPAEKAAADQPGSERKRQARRQLAS